MKPPICEICNNSFSPRDGELISFLDDSTTKVFDDRAKQPGFVGHRPNRGWFCAKHCDDAQKLAPTMTLTSAIGELLGEPKHASAKSLDGRATVVDQISSAGETSAANQVIGKHHEPEINPWPAIGKLGDGTASCASCESVFPEKAGGIIEFFEEYSVKVKRSLLAGNARFERPSRRWFCPRHIGPAMMIRDTIGLDMARQILVPDDREPFEYNEAPPSVTIGSVDDQGEPLRGPYIPMPDLAFDAVTPKVFPISNRIARDASDILRNASKLALSALQVSHSRTPGSIGSESQDPDDLRWMRGPFKCRTNVGLRHGADVVAFTISARYLDGQEVVGEHCRILVQHREQSVFEAVVVANQDAALAPDGLVLLNELHVRVVEEYGSRFADMIQSLNELLNQVAADPFADNSDINGADLQGGKIRRGALDTNSSFIEWKIEPVATHIIRQQFLDLLPKLLNELNLGPLPELELKQNRSWSPMDGSREPDCPYEDRVRWTANDDTGLMISVSSSQAHWSDQSISNVSASLYVKLGEICVSIGASGRGEHDRCTTLTLSRPTSPLVIRIVTSAFAPLLRSDEAD